MTRRAERTGAVARALKSKSVLRSVVRPGLRSMSAKDRAHVAAEIRSEFVDGLALDDALGKHPSHVNANRWDFLLGHEPTHGIIGLEVHPAKNSEVKLVVAKRDWAEGIIRAEFVAGAKVHRWFWAASGSNGIIPGSTEARQITAANIRFVGSELRRAHLTWSDQR